MFRRNGGLAALLLGVGCLVCAQQSPKLKYVTPENISPANGARMFRTYCAVCHGVVGKGDGPAAGALRNQPTDLTQLSRNNDGKFPVFRVAGVIQGSSISKVHGTREMPVWGAVFRTMGSGTVKLRIDNLTSYVESLQQE